MSQKNKRDDAPTREDLEHQLKQARKECKELKEEVDIKREQRDFYIKKADRAEEALEEFKNGIEEDLETRKRNAQTCSGCREEQCNQLAHCEDGGCLCSPPPLSQ